MLNKKSISNYLYENGDVIEGLLGKHTLEELTEDISQYIETYKKPDLTDLEVISAIKERAMSLRFKNISNFVGKKIIVEKTDDIEIVSVVKKTLNILELFLTNIDKLTEKERGILIEAIRGLSNPVMKWEQPGVVGKEQSKRDQGIE